jgi:ABC-2 type transport system ATP-binding protein
MRGDRGKLLIESAASPPISETGMNAATISPPVATEAPADAAIRTRALRKVYPFPARRRGRPGGPPGAAPGGPFAAPGAAHAAAPAGMSKEGIVALDGLDLDVRAGEFFGLLGPNGAGKTTTIGILTTRVRPTSGQAWIAGTDVVRDDVAVRHRIGIVPQRPNADRALNVRENLLYHAAYFGIPRGEAIARAQRLLDTFGIADRAGSKTDQLSGGMQQRLMVARALMHDPQVLFLDEPTGGLDPQGRLALWDILRRLHADGHTIVMTTHNMEEADRLCQRVAIVDRGRLLALDTPAALKAKAPGGTLIELILDGDSTAAAEKAKAIGGLLKVEHEGSSLRAWAARPGETIAGLIHAAEEAGREVHDIHLAPPSLETLFVSLTGRKLE